MSVHRGYLIERKSYSPTEPPEVEAFVCFVLKSFHFASFVLPVYFRLNSLLSPFVLIKLYLNSLILPSFLFIFLLILDALVTIACFLLVSLFLLSVIYIFFPFFLFLPIFHHFLLTFRDFSLAYGPGMASLLSCLQFL